MSATVIAFPVKEPRLADISAETTGLSKNPVPDSECVDLRAFIVPRVKLCIVSENVQPAGMGPRQARRAFFAMLRGDKAAFTALSDIVSRAHEAQRALEAELTEAQRLMMASFRCEAPAAARRLMKKLSKGIQEGKSPRRKRKQSA